MEKNCLYCQSPFTTNREGKKYCNDNCKQMAYLGRNGLKRVGNQKLREVNFRPRVMPSEQLLQELELKDSEETNDFAVKNEVDNTNDVKQNRTVDHVNISVTQQEEKPVKESVLSSRTLEDFVALLTKKMEQRLDIAIKKIQQEFYGKAQSDFSSLEKNEEEAPALKLDIPKLALLNVVPSPDKEQQGEYHWVESKLIKNTEKYLNQFMGGLKFIRPLEYWDIHGVYCITWINDRLKCLLENLLKLSNVNYVNRGSVIALSRAFTTLANSEAFAHLPSDYPFISVIEYLSSTLSQLMTNSYAEELKIHFSVERKALLVAVVRSLANSCSIIKFNELDFTEDENIFYKSPSKNTESKQGTTQALKGWRARALKQEGRNKG